MKQFFMEQSGSENKEKFIIKDRRGEETYTVILNDLEEEHLLISDFKKNPVVLVKQKKGNDQSQFAVLLDGETAFYIEKDETTSKLTASSDELTIDGDLLDMTFDVMFGYRKVGKIRKRWITSNDAYELTVFEDDRETALIGLLAVLNITINLTKIA
ncbi:MULTISPECIES: hypothetical protein [Vagococcus]|uniref:hypothetical protein n=1 Tax=Vagococcus TaxID=2737 RepID=UPI002FC8EBF0